MNDILWKKVHKLWEEAAEKKELIEKYNDYWAGNYKDLKTPFNIIKPIIETKLKAMLDAQFTLSVVPDISSFEDLQTCQDLQDVADIYNDELHNILEENNINLIKEQVARDGIRTGFGAVQTIWDNEKDIKGKVKINYIQNKNLRWDKNATSIEDATYISYKISMSPAVIKSKYCRNTDGSFDIEKCNQIDEITEKEKDDIVQDRGLFQRFSGYISNFITPQTAGQAFMVPKIYGIKGNKSVSLIVMFLLDDSLYSPENNDDTEQTEFKEKSILQYPYGRMIIFSDDEKDKLIFEDKPLDEVFLHLGNIDIFNPIKTEKIEGKGEIEDLTGIQDRVNTLSDRFRDLVNDDFSCLLMDKSSFDSNTILGSITKKPVVFYNGASGIIPQIVSNDNISRAMEIINSISNLEEGAYKLARVNETMLYGTRQTGTTSGEQLELLQENPQTEIRACQRNFSDFFISVGKKCLAYIHNNYSVQRLIKLSNSSEYEYAQITNDAEQEDAQYIDLLDKAGQAIKRIKLNKDWKFQVKVIAGTEVPRSRKELSNLIDKLAMNGVLGDINDLDFKKIYLKAQDIPNSNAFIQLLDKRAKETENQSLTMTDILKNPNLSKSLSEIFKALEGFSIAKSQILQTLGIEATVDTLETAPIQETASQSDINEIALLAPNTISSNPEGMLQSQNYARAHELTKAADALNIKKNEKVEGF
jgi:hypothetical protein